MTNALLQGVMKFNDPKSASVAFREKVDGHDRYWRGKDWSKDARPPVSAFWLYKTAECVAWIVELQVEIETAYRKLPGTLPAQVLIGQTVVELANFYRGAWIAETCAAGEMSQDLSDPTRTVVFELLARIEALCIENRGRKTVTASLRRALQDICNSMLARYDAIKDTLPPAPRDDLVAGIVRRRRYFDHQLASVACTSGAR